MGNPARNGILAIDKSAGISSFGVIRRLRSITGIRKIGHTGTLDPFATGLLICLLGSYTRLASYLEAEDKSYLATVQLGSKTSTGDTEGEIIENGNVPELIPDSLSSKAMQLTELPVPAYSAIKLQGKRAYQYARNGEAVEMPTRPTRISSFEFVPFEEGRLISPLGEVSYRCTVSKGTYIRSLSQWLAEKLGTVGHTTSLRRETIGRMRVDNAVTLDTLEQNNWQDYLLPPREVFTVFNAVEIDASQEHLVANGNAVDVDKPLVNPALNTALYGRDGSLLALANAEDGTLKPFIVLARS